MSSRPTINSRFKYDMLEALRRDEKLQNEFKGTEGGGGGKRGLPVG